MTAKARAQVRFRRALRTDQALRLVMVWRRDADGRWRIARELPNEDV